MSEAMSRPGTVKLPKDIVDLDSHEMLPMEMWEAEFGPETLGVWELVRGLMSRVGENTLSQPGVDDVMEITDEIVWNQKGVKAPGAIDMSRRPQVMEAMGIERQLVFPTMALAALSVVVNNGAPRIFGFDPESCDYRAVGRQGVDAHNRWVERKLGELGPSVRCVGMMLTESIEQMMTDVRRLADAGVKAIWIPSGLPPAGTSPADRALDQFWAFVAERDIALVLHLGTEFGLLSDKWHANVPEFEYGEASSVEFTVEPYRASTLNFTAENFLTAMIMGGVFARHPRLRIGVIECGAQWVGPLAERLDTWATQFTKRLAQLTMKPSEYLNRNVRVTPFSFEPVGQYYDRWPNLGDVWCYSSDYPHREGGKASHLKFFNELSRHGQDVVDRFFRLNGLWLMPN